MGRFIHKGYDLCVCGHMRNKHIIGCHDYGDRKNFRTCDCVKFYYDDRRMQRSEQNNRKRNV